MAFDWPWSRLAIGVESGSPCSASAVVDGVVDAGKQESLESGLSAVPPVVELAAVELSYRDRSVSLFLNSHFKAFNFTHTYSKSL